MNDVAEDDFNGMTRLAIETIAALRKSVSSDGFTSRDSTKIILLDAANHPAGVEGLAFSMFVVTNHLIELAADFASKVPGSARRPDIDGILDLLRATFTDDN